MRILLLLLMLMPAVSYSGEVAGKFSKIQFKIEKQRTWFVVTSQAAETLTCYVMVDGWKKYFRLQPSASSGWYKAKWGFSHSDVSWDCTPNRYWRRGRGAY